MPNLLDLERIFSALDLRTDAEPNERGSLVLAIVFALAWGFAALAFGVLR